MSSTTPATRGGEGDDFFETPAWATRSILPHLGPLGERWILEPSAGRGAIVGELIAAGANPARILAVEKDERRADALCDAHPRVMVREHDFLAYGSSDAGLTELIVMNPPFKGAQEHVEHALSLLAAGGVCAALLRLAFCVSAKRAAFRAAHPFDLFPLASRPSFTPDGKTDSADYAWFVFGDGRGGRFAVLEGKPG